MSNWQERNREYLAHAVDDLRARIDRQADGIVPSEPLERAKNEMDAPPALEVLTAQFNLGRFEHDLVVLTFAAELDPQFREPVTLESAVRDLPSAHWSALDDAAPLRAWGIVELERAATLAESRLRLAPDVARHLMGFDTRADFGEIFAVAPPLPAVVERQTRLATEIAVAIATTIDAAEAWPAVELHGAQEEERIAIAQLTAQALGMDVATADARDLPEPGQDLDTLLKTWSRRSRMSNTLLCITDAGGRDEEPSIRHRVNRALARIRGPFFLTADAPTTFEAARPVLRRQVTPLDADERNEVWEVMVTELRRRLNTRRSKGLPQALRALAIDFALGARTVQRVCIETEAALSTHQEPIEPQDIAHHLRQGCARFVRARLDPLAQRLHTDQIADVALPQREAEQLDHLEQAIRLTHEITARWGVGQGRSGGVTALFAGPSGTGKTYAALALARRLGLDLYRVDLAQVLSKYIGETEENLDKIFAGAEIGGAILLFDEADALFGKRSEVKDSHDRYANLSTAYLLARIEAAPAPTILTTNLKDALDPAFLRRLQFVIDFPFPSKTERETIWRTIYPDTTPVAGLQPNRLATVAATGGTISNIARRGALLAAAEPAPVEMRHLLTATELELTKLGRDMTPEERAAWHRSA